MDLIKRRKLVNFVLVQILFAIAAYQKTYHIVHGDLHEGNVFLVFDPSLIWKGEKIGNFDYYEYKIGGSKANTTLYLPAIPVIVKIGDFGLAVKYSKNGGPIIGSEHTMRNGYDQGDGNGPWLPNFYNTSYDVVHIVNIFKRENPSNEFVKQIAAWICGLEQGYTSKELDSAMESIIVESTGRPKIKELEGKLKHVSAEAILKNKELMEGYLNKPPKQSKVLVLGEI